MSVAWTLYRPTRLLCSCIKQTYVFCEAPIFLVLIACFIAGRSLHDVAPSPAVSCHQPERQRLRYSKHICTIPLKTNNMQKSIRVENQVWSLWTPHRFSSRHSIRFRFHFTSFMNCARGSVYLCVIHQLQCDTLILYAGGDTAGRKNDWMRVREGRK